MADTLARAGCSRVDGDIPEFWYGPKFGPLDEAANAGDLTLLLVDHMAKSCENGKSAIGAAQKEENLKRVFYSDGDGFTAALGGQFLLTCGKDHIGEMAENDVVAYFRRELLGDQSIFRLVSADPAQHRDTTPAERHKATDDAIRGGATTNAAI